MGILTRIPDLILLPRKTKGKSHTKLLKRPRSQQKKRRKKWSLTRKKKNQKATNLKETVVTTFPYCIQLRKVSRKVVEIQANLQLLQSTNHPARKQRMQSERVKALECMIPMWMDILLWVAQLKPVLCRPLRKHLRNALPRVAWAARVP